MTAGHKKGSEDEVAKAYAERWLALEGMAAAPIPDSARAVGVLLIISRNMETGLCYPGEAYLAGHLGYEISTVKRAKSRLREAGLIDWTVRGRLHQSFYTFDFPRLTALATEARERGKEAARIRQSSSTATLQGGTTATLQGGSETTLQASADTSQSGSTISQSGFGDLQSGCRVSHRVAVEPPEQIREQIKITSHQQRGAPGAHAAALLEELRHKRSSHFPKVEKAFEGEPATLDTYFALDVERQGEASWALMRPGGGRDAARAVILQSRGGEP